jgi:predicted Fe-Mo cluster-binding NifX family protein
MIVCVPILKEEGARSPVSPHFGSAPLFALVDTAGGGIRFVTNRNDAHEHGRCSPLRALQGERIDAVAVLGIGGGALAKLRAAGIRVYQAEQDTAGAAAAAVGNGSAREVTDDGACAGHGHHH